MNNKQKHLRNLCEWLMYAFSKREAMEIAHRLDGCCKSLTIIYFFNQDFEKDGNTIGQRQDPSHVLAFGNELCDAQAAANAGIKAYHCLWGADVKEKEQMLADSEHQCITSPLQIIDILRSEKVEYSAHTRVCA